MSLQISRPEHILILGGTTEAIKLASRLVERGLQVTTSLAGRTRSAKPVPGDCRVGGFGGVNGMKDWIKQHSVTRIVDATHPFAAQITLNANEACIDTQIPLCHLERPAWSLRPGDNWVRVSSHDDVKIHLRAYTRIFLTTGRLDLATYASVTDKWFLMRMIDDPGDIIRPSGKVLLSRPGSSVEDEKTLLQCYQIDCLVTKNAGGNLSYNKVEAARLLDLPVIMINRPQIPDGFIVSTVEAVEDWVISG